MACLVRVQILAAHRAHDRADVDDPTVAGLLHGAAALAHQYERPAQVGRDHAVKVVGRKVADLVPPIDSGVVHEDVDPPVLLNDAPHRRLARGFGRDGERDALAARAGARIDEPLLRGRDAFGRRAGENDVRAALGEAERDRVADATRSTGNDGDLAVESEIERRMLLLLLLLAAARDGARDRGGRGDAGEAAQHGRVFRLQRLDASDVFRTAKPAPLRRLRARPAGVWWEYSALQPYHTPRYKAVFRRCSGSRATATGSLARRAEVDTQARAS